MCHLCLFLLALLCQSLQSISLSCIVVFHQPPFLFYLMSPDLILFFAHLLVPATFEHQYLIVKPAEEDVQTWRTIPTEIYFNFCLLTDMWLKVGEKIRVIWQNMEEFALFSNSSDASRPKSDGVRGFRKPPSSPPPV